MNGDPASAANPAWLLGSRAVRTVSVPAGDAGRLEAVVELLAAETRRFAKDHPELDGINRTYDKMPHNTKLAVRENSERFRDENQEQWSRWLLDDLSAIVSAGIERRERQSAPV